MDIATMFKHLSPSHANDWIERRAMGWYARRVLGRDTGPMPPQVHAGTAMEKGIIDSFLMEDGDDNS